MAKLSTETSAASGGAWKIHAALLVVQIAFASQAVEGKVAMLPRAEGGEAISPAALGMARMIAGALFFQIVGRALGWIAATTRREKIALAALSVLGVSLNQGLFLVGLRSTSPVSAALLSVTIPVFTAMLAVLFRQERASWRVGLGLALSLSGALWLTGVRDVDHGALIVLANSLSYAAYLVLAKPYIQRLGAMTVVAWVFVFGAAAFSIVGAVPLVHAVPELTPRGVVFVLYIVAMPTVVAYSANAWALGRSTASLVTIYIYLQPILAALLAWLQLGHAVSSRLFVAAALILCGVTIVVRRGPAPARGARALR